MSTAPASRKQKLRRRRFLLGWVFIVLWLVVMELNSIPLPFDPDDNNESIVPPGKQESRIYASVGLASVVIFYHLYIPRHSDVVGRQAQRARQIVRQQLRQLSHTLETVPGLPPVPVYYTSVGTDLGEYVQDICGNLTSVTCHRLQHLEEGFEEHTLQALYEHCHHFPNDRVIYLHSKGSYHGSKGQDQWRRHMTDAVASQDCIHKAHQWDCDLCGLLFVPRPSLHFTGNMFNAKCSHIQKLIPPMEFPARMQILYEKARKDGIFVSNLFDMDEPWNSGTQRYAMEHWHGSHPNVDKICDVSNHSTNKFWKSNANRTLLQDWQLDWFPRRPQSGMPVGVANDESKRKREYFLLPGQLWKWYELYGQVPGESSWVWSWYPDGLFWKDQVRQHGAKAVEVVSSQWRNA